MMTDSWPERHIDWSNLMTKIMATEPVRLYALIAGLLTAVGGALVAIGEGVDPLVAIGGAVVSFGLIVGGGELGRAQAYSPARHNAEVDQLRNVLDEVGEAEATLRAERP